MSKIVFDIETVGVDFEALAQDEQDYILKYAEDEKKIKEAKSKLGLWPFTGEIAAICLFNPDTQKGKTYFQAPKEQIKPFVEDDIEYETMTEKEILERFWRDIKNYRQFITFNGRGFDCPYIMLRSAVLKIRPTVNLMPYRYDPSVHVDLLDQLTFYGAFRKFSLNFYCKTFGLSNQKIESMGGEKIQQYFKDGKFLEIARYCSADVKATAELFERWEKYIKL
ncbi:MAG: 3'-5' exonuclease, PolB [Parcubacteria group bacterium LiPW_39]|nr:MAG: 3'-5' exonuclease, PolB [Parcubacteria group bacterium LiPW_39]